MGGEHQHLDLEGLLSALTAQLNEHVARIEDHEDRLQDLEQTPPPPDPDPDPPTYTPSPPITVTQSGRIVEGLSFSNVSGDAIRITASNVTIRNCRFENVVKGVYAVNSSNVIVEDCEFRANQAGRGRNAVQFDKVNGGRISRLDSRVTIGATLAEDHISLYQSQGTQNSPIIVEDCYLEGGGPSTSGSGIMTGDVGGSWQTIRRNVLVNPGQVGIGVSGGTNVVVEDNEVYSAAHPWSNVGIYVWRYTGTQPCGNHTVQRNKVDWRRSNGARNSFWDGGNCGTISGLSSNDWNWTR